VRLIERVAIVTGAGSGVGAAIARAFAAEGADLVLAGRRPEPLEDTASVVRGLGPRALVMPTNVATEVDVRALVARTVEELGRVDVLVNAAASPGDETTVANMTLAAWNETLQSTLTGAMLCTRECLIRSMLPRRAGSIVNIASTAGLRGVAARSHFSAAKAGLIRFTESVAREVGPQGIRANCIVPGPVATERLNLYHERLSATRGVAVERVVEEASRQVALRRLITPDEIAAVAVFLASEQSSGITAETVRVTGG
jgi:NAD(P)-dependent dehydrogenase (short-subunit alcohol dehydrogenase family)